MTKNQFVAEKLGMRWHKCIDKPELTTYKCSCGKIERGLYTHGQLNPNFSTDAGAVQLLRLMEQQDYWPELCIKLGLYEQYDQGEEGTEVEWMLINIKYLTTPGAFLDAVAEFFGWEEGK